MSSSTLKEKTKPAALKYIVILKALNIHLILKTFMTTGGVRSTKRRTYRSYKQIVERYAHTGFTLSEAFVLHGRFFCAHLNPTTTICLLRMPIAGLYVMSRRPCWWSRAKALLSPGKSTPFSCKFFEEKLFCFDLQHGRLVRWWQTKNSTLKTLRPRPKESGHF